MDKFLLAENPQIPIGNRKIYIMHTQQPPMLIRVYHEAISIGNDYDILSGQYENNGIIETITLQVSTLLICEQTVSDELKLKVQKTLSKAWYWYTSYLKFEDDLLNENDKANDN